MSAVPRDACRITEVFEVGDWIDRLDAALSMKARGANPGCGNVVRARTQSSVQVGAAVEGDGNCVGEPPRRLGWTTKPVHPSGRIADDLGLGYRKT